MRVSAVDPLPVEVQPDAVDWLTALGTVGAVVVAVTVAVIEVVRAQQARRERDAVIEAQRAAEHRSIARLVSAWVETTYLPSEDGRHYQKIDIAHINNEGDLPVFEVRPLVIMSPAVPDGSKPVVLGPLSIPSTIAVLPPRREFLFDLSLPLRAHRQDEERGAFPRVAGIEIGFTDPNGVRWVRAHDGGLVESTRTVGGLVESTDEESVLRQVGRMDASNPLAVVFGFLTIITDDSLSDSEALKKLKETLAPEAAGWKDLNAQTLADLRLELADYHVGSHVLYPVPNIAYVKIVQSDAENLTVVQGDDVVVPAKIGTLTFTSDRGWRIFTYGGGGTPADQIYFPKGMK